MRFTREEIEEQRDLVVAWAQFRCKVVEVVSSGRAGGLYPEQVEKLALRYLGMIHGMETDNLIDMVKEV